MNKGRGPEARKIVSSGEKMFHALEKPKMQAF